MRYDVFVSYSSKDQKVVEGLSAYLEQNGVRCFVAYRDIPKGRVWAEVITEAIEDCQLMVVVFSESFNHSDQVNREIELCSEEKKAILTFRISDAVFTGAKKYYLKNINWIDAFPDPKASFGALLNSIKKLIDKVPVDNVLILTCPSCGQTLSKGSHFCPTCGKPLKIQSQIANQDVFFHEVKKESSLLIPSGFVRVDGGRFMMGGNSYSDEKPIHQVTLSTFYMGKYQVTQRQWREVMDTNPSRFKWDDLPVEGVCWYDAISYCNALSKKEGYEGCYRINGESANYLPSATGYRLPTEAEWEYAARGGNRKDSYLYSGSNILEEVAWYDKNSGNKTHSVGQKKQNSLGLYDMSGNVWEWCWDWKDAYPSSALVNPLGSTAGSFRVIRGGSWGHSASINTVSYRSRFAARNTNNFLGFRLVFAFSSK